MNHPDQTLPELLVNSAGQPHWGIFPGSVAHINGLQADYRSALGKPVPRWQRRFHYKQFQYFGVISNDILIGCALADTAWLGLAFVYVFDSRSGKLQEYTWRSPLARAMQLSESPVQGESHFRQPGVDIRLGYRNNNGTLIKPCRCTVMRCPCRQKWRKRHLYAHVVVHTGRHQWLGLCQQGRRHAGYRAADTG